MIRRIYSMFKKIISAIAIVLIAAAPVWATDVYPYGDSQSSVGGHSYDQSHSQTGWWGNYNDNAGAQAGSGGNASTYSLYTGNNGIAFSEADAAGASKTGSFAMDFGRTSFSGANAATVIGVSTSGGAVATDPHYWWSSKPSAFSASQAEITGGAGQFNNAAETGYGGAYASGGNQSGAQFYATAGMASYDNFGWNRDANSGAALVGTANAQGTTFVTVDPYGNHRSASGITQNSACASYAGGPFAYGQTNVNGQGGLETGAQVGNPSNGAFAQTSGSFNYNSTAPWNQQGSGMSAGTSEVNLSTPCYGCNSFSASASAITTTQVTPTYFCSGPSCGR
jgi:hypothetical protein